MFREHATYGCWPCLNHTFHPTQELQAKQHDQQPPPLLIHPPPSTDEEETSTESELNSLLMNQQHLLSGVASSAASAGAAVSTVVHQEDPFLQQPPASASFDDDEDDDDEDDVENSSKIGLAHAHQQNSDNNAAPKSLLSRKSFIDAVGNVAASASSSSSFPSVRILSPPGASAGAQSASATGNSLANGGNVIRLGR